MSGRTRVAPVLVGCLLLSGAAALVYEVVWMRELALVMGRTVYALSALLAAYLGGLALGAHVGGRWAARHAVSLRLYAILELAIAASALAMPVLVQASTPLFGAAYRSLGHSFVAYNLVQLLVCGAILPAARDARWARRSPS